MYAARRVVAGLSALALGAHVVGCFLVVDFGDEPTPSGSTSMATGGAGAGSGGTGPTGGSGGDGSGGSGAGDCAPRPSGTFPDSPTEFCTNGSIALPRCPVAGDLGYGQDGNYAGNIPTYTSDQGTVFDNASELTWTEDASPSKLTWEEATTYCNMLTTAGKMWRLPTRLELIGLADYGVTNPAVTAYPPTDAFFYWSSDVAPASAEAWLVGLDIEGGAHRADASLDMELGAEIHARCVSGQASPPQGFVPACGGEVVVDGRTGLLWERETHTDMITWLDALDACESFVFLGYDDWRLPSIKELSTLVDEQREGPAIDPDAFPNAIAVEYWSSSPSRVAVGEAWTVHFDTGRNARKPTATTNLPVRCVR